VNYLCIGTGSGVNIIGRAEGGQIKNGQKVLVMPAAVKGQAKSISVHGEPADWAQAGDHVTLTLHGLDMVNITYVFIYIIKWTTKQWLKPQ
jgi:elongation factor 1 alpha-like protein